MRQLLLDVLRAPQPSLDNFVGGPNAEALALTSDLQAGHCLYLWGPSGSGRTHLLRAAVLAHGGRYVQATDAQLPIPELLHGVLAVDDVEQLTQAGQSWLFDCFNVWRASQAAARAQGGLALLISGTAPPAQLAVREDLRTRLAWDQVCRLHWLDDAHKREALSSHLLDRGLRVPLEILDHLLVHHTRDLRQLLGLLDAFDAYSLEHQRAPTLPLLRSMLAERSPAEHTVS